MPSRNNLTYLRLLLLVAPIKALCSERYEDWSSRFAALGLKCLELTGDSLMYDYSELQHVHIILTTPVSSLLCGPHTCSPHYALLSVSPSVRLSSKLKEKVLQSSNLVSGIAIATVTVIAILRSEVKVTRFKHSSF